MWKTRAFFRVCAPVCVAVGAMISYSFAVQGDEIELRTLTPGKDFEIKVETMEWVFTQEQEQRYGLRLDSDMAMPALKKNGIFYWWITGLRTDMESTETCWAYRFSGHEFPLMKPDPVDESGKALAVLKNDPGTFDNHYVGISALYLDDTTGKLYAWYHAEDTDFPASIIRTSQKMVSGYREDPYFSSIGAAVSTDFGQTFNKIGQVIRAVKNKRDIEEAVLHDPNNYWGVEMGNPSVIRIRDHLYLYYCDILPDGLSGISLARLSIEDLKQATQPWKKYYKGSFVEPGLGGRFDVLVDAIYASVGYNTYLKQFLMVHAGPDHQNIFLRTSPDGISWSSPELLVTGHPPTWNLYPTLIDDGADPRITDDSFWLYYSYSPDESQAGHRLVRRRISLGKK